MVFTLVVSQLAANKQEAEDECISDISEIPMSRGLADNTNLGHLTGDGRDAVTIDSWDTPVVSVLGSKQVASACRSMKK